jgi:PAS domain S-box-containing protein
MISALYVDDETDLLDIAKFFLESLGEFSVTTENSARNAIELTIFRNFDVVVSDFQMPEMDGIEFLKAIREMDKNIPFILFTGRGREEVVIGAINNGADFYVQKGGEPEAQFAELAHKIRQAVARRKAEISLVESEKRLADIINFLPDATFAIDTHGLVISWNRAIEELTGLAADEMIGKGDHEYALPFYNNRRPILIDLIRESDETIGRYYSNILRQGATLTAETDLPHPKGRRIHVLTKASPLCNGQGDIIGAIESIRDITGLKRAEEGLSQAKKDWETIFRDIGHPAMVLDSQNCIIDFNDATIKATGLSPEELTGRHCYEVFHGPDSVRSPDGCPFEESATSGRTVLAELEIEAFNGFYAVSCTPVFDRLGNLEKVIHIAMDVTDRRRTQDELRAAYEQMAASDEELRSQLQTLARSDRMVSESEGKFRAIFEKTHDALILFRDYRCIDCNYQASVLFGFQSQSEMIGLHPDDLSAPFQDDGEESGPVLASHIRTVSESGMDQFAWLQKKKDGTLFPAEVILSAFELDGNPVFLASIRDITERRR